MLTDKDLRLATVHFQSKGGGVEIECRGCRQLFISKGLRCCSTGCERKHREREEIAATMAEAGMEPSAKRKCEAVGCGANIPRYVGVGKARRETRKDARFCSPRCSRKARVASDSQTAVLDTIDAKKALQNGPLNDRSKVGPTPAKPHSDDTGAAAAATLVYNAMHASGAPF